MGRRMGQHFLHSQEVLAKIIAEAGVEAGEPVLEIGPGRGVLTERLLATGARVTAVELDPVLCTHLRSRWGDHPAFQLVEGDVLKLDVSPRALFGEEQPYALIANLPYYLTSPLLFRLMLQRRGINRMLLMVQREIAERLVAGPEQGKSYGSLGIAAQLAFQMRLCFVVPPGAFSPPPKVDSAVVAFHPLEPHLEPALESRYLEHVKGLFSTRRKMMLSTLRKKEPQAVAQAGEALVSLLGNARPDALTPAQHLQAFQLLHPRL